MISVSNSLRTCNVGPVERIPFGEGRAFRVGSEDIAVFRSRSGEVFAVQAYCPHRGGPLADGLIGDRRVICPLHGYPFDLATGEPLRQPCSALRTHPVEITGAGELVIHLAERAPETPDWRSDASCAESTAGSTAAR